jgi:hypothetical protein
VVSFTVVVVVVVVVVVAIVVGAGAPEESFMPDPANHVNECTPLNGN